MKAAVVCANEDVQYLDYEEPIPGPGEVKVKVRASGICGSDIPRVLHNGVHFYPIVLGHEFSGDVVEIGEGVTKVKVGDRVSGAPLKPCMKCDDCQKGNFSLCKHYSFIGSREQGSNADYVVIPEQNAVVYDSSISYEQAAMFEPSTVALHGLLQNEYQGGQYVAVLGGGTIGMFTMQWAKISAPEKLWYLTSARSVWNWQNVWVQMQSSIQRKKIICRKQWHLPGKRDMAMCSRRQDRSRLCIWHLNLRAIKQMSALSEHHMQSLHSHRQCGRI